MDYSRIGVIGLGYVGLPLACLCAKRGYEVIGFDTSYRVISQLLQGKSHIRDHSTEKLLSEALVSSHFSPTSDPLVLSSCNIYIICVPTPITSHHEPDLTPLKGAIELISSHLREGDLVVVESTVFPGTCEHIIAPMISDLTGLDCNGQISLAHCPERVNPGDHFWTAENIPRVVGAMDQFGANRAAQFYASILGGQIYDVRDVRSYFRPKFSLGNIGELVTKQLPLGSVTKMRSIRDAEAVKAMENTVRDVNIAFVNELAMISDVLGLDVVDIIDGMSTKPFGKGPFYPGAGVGGHCIAVDPEWLKDASIKAGYMPELIQLSRNTNNQMPNYTVGVLQDLYSELLLPIRGQSVAILGVAYKRNVDDSRESPFYAIRDLLVSKGANVNIYDSWVTTENTHSSLADALKNVSGVLIVTDHDDMIAEFLQLDLLSLELKVVVDGRNVIDKKSLPDSILYRGIGRR